jgi:uridine phosphorylase
MPDPEGMPAPHLGVPATHLGTHSIPLTEFDPAPVAMIEPSSHFGAPERERPDVPAVGVACFFGNAVERIARENNARVITRMYAEHGLNALYEIEHQGERLAFWQAGLGAPLSVGYLEEAIDFGCRSIVACGGAGALDSGLALGHVVVVGDALRDEGTSYHYLPPSRTVAAEPEVVTVLARLLEEAGVPHEVGRTWTTDAIYRETREKVARRRAEGCITVEMEAAALLAVAQFRKIRFGQLLYAGDSLAGDEWDHRNWVHAHDVREQMFWLAADAALQLARRPATGSVSAASHRGARATPS